MITDEIYTELRKRIDTLEIKVMQLRSGAIEITVRKDEVYVAYVNTPIFFLLARGDDYAIVADALVVRWAKERYLRGVPPVWAEVSA